MCCILFFYGFFPHFTLQMATSSIKNRTTHVSFGNSPPFKDGTVYSARHSELQIRYARSDFFNCEEGLLEDIETYGKGKFILGCMAWFTSKPVIEALGKAKGVLILVDDSETNYHAFDLYLKNLRPISRGVLGKIGDPSLQYLSKNTDFAPVRMVPCGSGIMHSKIILFLDDFLVPCAVHIGSYNLTAAGANRNIENAATFESREFCAPYLNNFVTLLSESKKLPDKSWLNGLPPHNLESFYDRDQKYFATYGPLNINPAKIQGSLFKSKSNKPFLKRKRTTYI